MFKIKLLLPCLVTALLISGSAWAIGLRSIEKDRSAPREQNHLSKGKMHQHFKSLLGGTQRLYWKVRNVLSNIRVAPKKKAKTLSLAEFAEKGTLVPFGKNDPLSLSAFRSEMNPKGTHSWKTTLGEMWAWE